MIAIAKPAGRAAAPRFAATGLCLALAACAATPPQAKPRMAQACPHIPDAPAEPKLLPAKSGFPQILQPGTWQWTGHAYFWQPPRWLTFLGKARPFWQAAMWENANGACIWHPAHFVAAPSSTSLPRRRNTIPVAGLVQNR